MSNRQNPRKTRENPHFRLTLLHMSVDEYWQPRRAREVMAELSRWGAFTPVDYTADQRLMAEWDFDIDLITDYVE